MDQHQPIKRRACEACRKLKVQCTFDSNHADTCARCLRSGKACIVTSRRRRHVAPNTSVSELEKKLNVLSASLEAIRANPSSAASDSAARSDRGGISEPEESSQQGSREYAAINSSSTPTFASNRMQSPLAQPDELYERGVLTAETAVAAFNYFRHSMLPHFPLILIPLDTDTSKFRRNNPILYLSAVNAASGMFPIEIQREVNHHLLRIFAERILLAGEKSVELVQAVQICCLWHYPPGKYEALKYYQLIHSACIMAIDIGLSRKRKNVRLKVASGLVDATNNPVERPRRTFNPNGDALDSRRAWLVCFFLASQTAQNLRRENLMRWSPYLDDCLQVLESATGSADSDEIICRWVRLQHLADDVGVQFSLEDPASCPGLDNPSVRFVLKCFESKLLNNSQIPMSQPLPDTLKMGESIAILYTHEVLLHAGTTSEADMQPPFTEDVLTAIRPAHAENLSAAHIASLSACVTSVHMVFDTFLSISAPTVRALPTFHFVRLIYATVVLIKIAMDTTVPNSEIGRMVKLSDLKIEEYLTSLTSLLISAAEGNQCANAQMFGIIVEVLRNLYQKQIKLKLEPAVEIPGLVPLSDPTNRLSPSTPSQQQLPARGIESGIPARTKPPAFDGIVQDYASENSSFSRPDTTEWRRSQAQDPWEDTTTLDTLMETFDFGAMDFNFNDGSFAGFFAGADQGYQVSCYPETTWNN